MTNLHAGSATGIDLAALTAIQDRLALAYRLCLSLAPKQAVGELLETVTNMPEWETVRAALARATRQHPDLNRLQDLLIEVSGYALPAGAQGTLSDAMDIARAISEAAPAATPQHPDTAAGAQVLEEIWGVYRTEADGAGGWLKDGPYVAQYTPRANAERLCTGPEYEPRRLLLVADAATPQHSVTEQAQPALTVWYGPMPESNGKSNFTAVLMRKDTGWSGPHVTIERGEYPDRIRYEADRVRHLIGEISEEPDILAYDANKHSGYVKPDRTQPLASTATTQPEQALRDEVIGCFRAADIEGLTEALASTPDERLKDLVERRLMHALCAALAIPASAPNGWEIAGYQMIARPKVFYHADWKPTDTNNFRTLYAPASTAASEQQAGADERAQRLIRELGRISMTLAADLVQGAAYTFEGHDYLDRDSVMERVVRWRTEWDATAPDRAALTHRATTATPMDAAGFFAEARRLGCKLPDDVCAQLATAPDIATTADQQGAAQGRVIDDNKLGILMTHHLAGNVPSDLYWRVDVTAEGLRRAAAVVQGAAQAQAGDAARLEFLERCVMKHGSINAKRDRDGTVGSPTFGDLPTVTLFTVPSQHKTGIGLRGAIDAAMAAPATSKETA